MGKFIARSQEHLAVVRNKGEADGQEQKWEPPRDGEFYLSSQYFERSDGRTPALRTAEEVEQDEMAKADMTALVQDPQVAEALSKLVSSSVKREQRLAAASFLIADLLPNAGTRSSKEHKI